MEQVKGVYYTTDDGRVSASALREEGRDPETADEISIEFDCPICDKTQVANFEAPLKQNQQYTCQETCGEAYYMHPMTATESGRSVLTMTIEDRVETQLQSIAKYHPIDRSVGVAGVEMLDEAKVGFMGVISILIGFASILFYATTVNLATINNQSISFMLFAVAVGIGAFAVLQGAIAPLFRGYVAYRNVRGRVNYSFPMFMRYAANYHHRKPF